MVNKQLFTEEEKNEKKEKKKILNENNYNHTEMSNSIKKIITINIVLKQNILITFEWI